MFGLGFFELLIVGTVVIGGVICVAVAVVLLTTQANRRRE
jgi:hypothetical protein